MPEPLIRSISDTARWTAYHRATESERVDALFRDPYARRLAGERGARIGRRLDENAWAVAIRTYLFDVVIRALLARNRIDMVVNLGAGLDSRSYRLELPERLQWVEIDTPEVLEEKQRVLAGETPHCRLECIAEDLCNEQRRRSVFSQLDQRSQRTLVICEGLLMYLDEEKVSSLAADLHAQPHFKYWLVEAESPMVVEWMNWRWSRYLDAAGARLGFAPRDWRSFYGSRGWKLVVFRSLAETAHRLKREPLFLKLVHRVGELNPWWARMQDQLWECGVALLHRA